MDIQQLGAKTWFRLTKQQIICKDNILSTAYFAGASNKGDDRGKNALVGHLQSLVGRRQLVLKRHLGIVMPRQSCKYTPASQQYMSA